NPPRDMSYISMINNHMLTEKFRFERTYNTDTQVDFPMSYNALLRCEQRNTEAAAYRLKH
ncbi:hypothetical protein V3H44_22860, partial [Vibrio parahaemolyticus]|uniref:hypothetical protein n=1 Tax=Vibrio parahaemolyticus TaxID=670 RepID=UPI003B684B36